VAQLLIAVGGVGAAGWWLWQQHWMARATAQVGEALVEASADMGLRIEDVFVVGRSRTPPATLLKAMEVARGAPILAFDLEAARQRVEALPWIRSASVQRVLPNTVIVRVVERQPLALWQNQGKFALIDEDGQVISRDDVSAFTELPVVVGDDAPGQTRALLELLAKEPELAPMVRAAVRVGRRRWNLSLAGGIDVRLPEENPADAWRRLAEYHRTHGVLRSDVKVVDLRLPDRLIVRRVAEPEEPAAAAPGGRET
jgi:cell division protein FtsQ